MEGTVISLIYCKFTVKIKVPVDVLKSTYLRKSDQRRISA